MSVLSMRKDRRLTWRPHVLVVCGNGLGVGVVGIGSLDSALQVGLEKELANVRDGGANVGAVAEDLTTLMSDEVNVRGTTLVVAWEDGVKGSDSVTVDGLHSTKEGGLLFIMSQWIPRAMQEIRTKLAASLELPLPLD